MGNANGREDGANGDLSGSLNGCEPIIPGAAAAAAVRVQSSDSMENTSPQSPRMSRSPLLFAPQDYVPENRASVTELEARGSPHSSYGQAFPMEEDFAKDPAVVLSQLHLTVLGPDNQDIASSSKPQDVVLNHLFIEKGWASQSVVALGLTLRFESKYVTVVLYKSLKR